MINYSQYMKDKKYEDHLHDAVNYFVNTMYNKAENKKNVDDKLKISFADAAINAELKKKNPVPKYIGTYIEFEMI